MITTAQRYADKAGTVPLHGTENVYHNGRYIGLVYQREGDGLWMANLMLPEEATATKAGAVAWLVAYRRKIGVAG